jgi:hypothetical protein
LSSIHIIKVRQILIQHPIKQRTYVICVELSMDFHISIEVVSMYKGLILAIFSLTLYFFLAVLLSFKQLSRHSTIPIFSDD